MNAFVKTPSLLLLTVLLSLSPTGFAQEKQDPVAVKVDGSPITKGEVEQEMQRNFAQQLQQMGQFPPEHQTAMRLQMEKQVVNQLIGRVLMTNAAKREGIKVEDAEISERMKEVLGVAMPEGTMDEFLKQTGMTEEKLRSELRENILVRKLIDQQTADVEKPTAEDVKEFYTSQKDQFKEPESVKARHILVRTMGVPEEEHAKKRAQIEEIRKGLLADEKADFAKVAMEKSEGPSAPQGGDLGQFGRGQMVPEFEEAAFTQKVGTIGEVIQTQFGYHIIKVEERNEARDLPFDEVKEKIDQYLLRQKKNDKMKELIDQWRAAAKIEMVGAPAASTPAAPEKKPGA